MSRRKPQRPARDVPVLDFTSRPVVDGDAQATPAAALGWGEPPMVPYELGAQDLAALVAGEPVSVRIGKLVVVELRPPQQ